MSGKPVYHITFSLIILLLWGGLNAQKPQVSNGVKLNSKVSNFKVLGKVSDKFVVERYGNNTHILDVYNTDLKNQMSRQILLNKNEFIETIWLQANSGWIIRVKNDKTTNYLIASKLDERISISQKPIVLDSIVERKDLLQANLRTKLSLNESKILIYAPIFSQGEVDCFYTSCLLYTSDAADE